MPALAFLIIGLACALIGRALLIGAAFRVGVGWGCGVLLPFGPLFFRLNHPEAARRSRLFRLATIPCFLAYFLLGPSPRQFLNQASPKASGHAFATATPAHVSFLRAPILAAQQALSAKRAADAPEVPGAGSVETITSGGKAASSDTSERRSANAAEFERLRTWTEVLRLKKRDLLHSDVAGAIAFNHEAARYNEALQKASAEKANLAVVGK